MEITSAVATASNRQSRNARRLRTLTPRNLWTAFEMTPNSAPRPTADQAGNCSGNAPVRCTRGPAGGLHMPSPSHCGSVPTSQAVPHKAKKSVKNARGIFLLRQSSWFPRECSWPTTTWTCWRRCQTRWPVWASTCVSVDSGAGLIDCLATDGPFDLIVTDISMPWMDSLKTLRSIRTAGVTTPVIVITALTDEQIPNRVQALGANAILLRKPFDLDELAAAAQRLTTGGLIGRRSAAVTGVSGSHSVLPWRTPRDVHDNSALSSFGDDAGTRRSGGDPPRPF